MALETIRQGRWRTHQQQAKASCKKDDILFSPFCFPGVGRTRNEESPALHGSALGLTLKSALHQIKTHFEVLQRGRNLCPLFIFFFFKERREAKKRRSSEP